jgi:predicted amidophosphoribosyltransferase
MTHVSTDTTILIKTKDTPPQTTLQRQARLKNIKDAFVAMTPKIMPEPATLIIVDDVVTTGATLMAARAALTPQLPPTTQIICLALAH